MLDGEKLLWLLKSLEVYLETLSAARFYFPDALTLRTLGLTLGGQVWHQLVLTRNNLAAGGRVTEQEKINNALIMIAKAPWRTDLDYLYYNPAFADISTDATSSSTAKRLKDSAYLRSLNCAGCRLSPVLG